MEQWPDVGFANVFGQTETLGAYTSLTPEDHRDPQRIGSVGRPCPASTSGSSIRTRARTRQPGQVGELWVRGEQTIGDGWLETGDLARRDDEGYLYPSGRRSDVINRGGEKFAPAEVVEALRNHPAIADVVVAGVPDDEMGERVGVAVVVRSGADDADDRRAASLVSWQARAVQAAGGRRRRGHAALQRARQAAASRRCAAHHVDRWRMGGRVTLYLHELHRVVGRCEDEFEAAFRDPGGWMQRLGEGADARLLWYATQAHGTGPAYRVVTITALADGAAWERLARSVQQGELHEWARHIDALRHDVTAKLLLARAMVAASTRST